MSTVRIAPIVLSVVLLGCLPMDAPVDNPVSTTPAATEPAPTASEPTEPAKVDPSDKINDAAALLTTDNPTSHQRAAVMLQEVLKSNPDSALAHFNLGVARYKMSDFGGAQQSLQDAIDRDRTLGDAWLYLGALQERAGQPSLAVATYRSGVQNDPDNIDLRVALIGALRRERKLDDAITEAKAALKINANSLPVYNNLGLVYIDRGDLDLAKFVYQKAMNTIDGASNNALVRCNLGRIYYLQGEKGPAIYHLLEAVKLDPTLVPANIYLSQIYLDDRNYADMVPLLETARREDPENHGVLMNLGIAYRGTGRFDEARQVYEKALLVDAGDPDPYFNLGILYGDYLKVGNEKQYDKAIEAFKTYIQKGGTERELASTYVSDLEKEKKKAERKKQQSTPGGGG